MSFKWYFIVVRALNKTLNLLNVFDVMNAFQKQHHVFYEVCKMKLQEIYEEENDNSLLKIIKKQGFKKSNGAITANGKRVKVIFLTKQEYFDSHDTMVNLTYIINPETHAWSFRAGLPGEKDVEFANGEDESTLIKHLERKTKIKPSAIDEYLIEDTNM